LDASEALKIDCINFRFQVIDNSCTVLGKLSAKAWVSIGTDYINFKNGCSCLVRNVVEELLAGTLCLSSPVVTAKWQQSISLQVESCADLATACKEQSAGVVTGGTVRGDTECQARHNGVDTVHVKGTLCEDAEHHAHHNGIDPEVVGSAEKPPVLVSCSTGATYAAGHVIVTCSLGCLKACCNTMFEPALPHSMIQVSDSNV
jgi:hypothetical protein